MDEEPGPFEWSLYQRDQDHEPGLGWSWTLLGVIGGFEGQGPAVVYLFQRGGTCYSSTQGPVPASALLLSCPELCRCS